MKGTIAVGRSQRQCQTLPMLFRPLVLALLVCGCFHPLPTKTLMGDVQFPLRSKQLPSGVRIILEEAKGSGRVAVMVGVAAGSSSDPIGKEGLAHVVEHLTFRARPTDTQTIRELHEFLGSSRHNAATDFDLTRFQAFGVCESLIGMVKIEVVRLSHPLKGIDARVFDLEREILRNELQLKLEAGISGESLATMQSLVFPEAHRYQRPIAGTAASLASLTLEDATAFTDAHYQPKNVTMVIVGDFDSAAIEADLLNAFCQSFLEGEAVARAPLAAVEVAQPPPGPLHPPVVRAGVDSTHLMLAWPGPAEDGSPSLISLERSLDAALSGRWADKDIGSSSVVILSGAHGSLVIAVVSLKLGLNPEESLAVVRNGLKALFNQPQRNLGTTFDRGMVLAAIVNSGELMSRALWRLEGTCYANDPRVISRTLKGLATLSAADQSALARGPQLGEVKELTLSNGLHVVAVRRPELPIVSVALAVPGGRARGPAGVAQMSSLYVPPPRRRSESAGGVYLLEKERETLADATVLQWHGGNGNLANLLALANNFMSDSRLSDES